MNLTISSSILNDTHKCSNCPNSYILYKLAEEDPTSIWICSYNANKLSNHAFVPSFLKCVGLLIVNDSPELDIHSLNSYKCDKFDLVDFIVLNLFYNSDSTTCLKESVTCFTVINKNDELITNLIPNSDIQWVDDDISEINKKQLHLTNISCLINLGLDIGDDGNTFDIIGLSSLCSLPIPIRDSVINAIKTRLTSSIQVQDYTNLPYDFIINEPRNISSFKDPYYTDLHNSGFGFLNTNRKHIFISNDCSNATLSLRILYQTVIPIPSNLLDIHSNESICYVVDKLCNDLTQLSNSIEQLTYLCCYISRDPIETKCDISELSISDTNANKITSSQPKHTNKGKSKKQSSGKNKRKTTRNHTNDKHAAEDYPSDLKDTNMRIISGLNFDCYYFDLDFYTGNGKINLIPSHSTEETVDLSSITINLIFKGFTADTTSTQGITFGGVTLSLCNLLYNGATDSSIDYPYKKRCKLLFHLPDLVNNKILISPHRHFNQHPPWISTKTSKSYLVSGYYQYYHYLHDGFNDVGWGCCYRSIQTVCSWYLLQNYTIRPVPNHQVIQELLKKNDISHKDLVVGSSTWIGTVESGYFINWYLNYTCKTLYLSDVSEFRSYNRVIADHFINQGIPIIMGVGVYAYVILGICIGESQGDSAYLIADPHYTGDDNIKSIHNKAAISWKGVDFISKVSDGKFINLCSPQLDIYDSNAG